MTSFIDLRASKPKPTPSKEKEKDREKDEITFNRITGSAIGARVPTQNQQSEITRSRVITQNQPSEITLLKPNKRLEGHDQYKLGSYEDNLNKSNYLSKNNKSDNFKKNIKNIQSGVADENIEEEYIKGLQDEIKLLEYELKLLKDKDLEQQASLSQLDKFFNDGVPINENILAMKNQYNIIKHESEGKSLKYEEEEKKYLKTNEELKADLIKLEEYFDLFSKEIKEKEKKYKITLDDLRKNFFEVKHSSAEMDKEYKIIQGKIRKLQDEIMSFTRAADKEEVLSVHREETRNQSIIKIKENILEKEKKISQLTKDLEELIGNEKVNPVIMHLDKENSEMIKQLMYIEKEINSAKSRCNDMQYLLEMQAKERMSETQLKRDMNLKLQDLLLHYKEEHNVKEKVLQQKVEEKEKIDIAEIKKRTDNIKTLINLYKGRISRCERDCENMIEHKMDVQQETLDEEQKNQMGNKEYEEMKIDFKEIKSGLELYLIQEKENKDQITPITLNIQDIIEKKPTYEEEIKRLKDAIYHFMKQIELHDHVKKFNLEELKVIAFNNNQVNNKILEFMHSFDNIQRMSKLPNNFLGK